MEQSTTKPKTNHFVADSWKEIFKTSYNALFQVCLVGMLNALVRFRCATMVFRRIQYNKQWYKNCSRSVSGITSGRSIRSGGVPLVPFARALSCKPAPFVLIIRRYRMASLLSYASYLGDFLAHSIIVLQLFFFHSFIHSQIYIAPFKVTAQKRDQLKCGQKGRF